jgi:hypothetical protein
MANKISDLRSVNKSGETSREYLLLSNIDSLASTKISLNDVLPTLQSGKTSGSVTAGTDGTTVQDLFVGGGVGSATSGTDKSVLIFKGINAEDSNGALTIRTDRGTADPNKRNIVLKLNHSNIKLNQADNATAKFLSETGGSNGLDLSDTTHYTGQLGVAGGGTGAATLAEGGVLLGSGTGAVTAMSVMAKGSLLVGTNTGSNTDPAELSVGTDGFTLVADSTQTNGVKWSKVSISTANLTTDINTNNNNIDIGTGWLSGSGSFTAGLRLSSSSDYIYAGSGTPYFDSFVNIEGGLTLGQSNGSSASTIKGKICTSGASPTVTLQGSDNGDDNNGGNVVVIGGAGETNGDGGDVLIKGGAKAGSGTDGSVTIQTAGTNAVVVDENQDVEFTGTLTTPADEGLTIKGTTTVTQTTSINTIVTLNAVAGVITLHGTALTAGDEQVFTFNNTNIATTSVILFQVQTAAGATENNGATLVANVGGDPSTGSCEVRLTNPGSATSSGTAKVHFLVINTTT